MPDREDDPTIPDDERLWRRIAPNQLKPIDGTGFEISSAAFRDKTGDLSVHLASLTTRERVLASWPAFSLAELRAAVPRSLEMKVVRDPLPEDPSHALVCPYATKRQAKELARRSTLVVTVPPAPSGATR